MPAAIRWCLPGVYLLACLAGLAGCVASKGGLPEGTYRGGDGRPGALIVDGSRVAFHTGRDADVESRWDGRSYPFDLEANGSLHFWGSSNDVHYLRIILDCRWRWVGDGFECRRDDG